MDNFDNTVNRITTKIVENLEEYCMGVESKSVDGLVSARKSLYRLQQAVQELNTVTGAFGKTLHTHSIVEKYGKG